MKLIFGLLILTIVSTHAGLPSCMDKKNKLTIDNHQALNIKEFMEQGYKTRAFIEGVSVSLMGNYSGHTHLEIDLDKDLKTTDDRIEVVYNNEYGELPEIQINDTISACGDFIVDRSSPHQAIIHWVHKSPNAKKHDDGFLAINGIIFGR